MTAVNLQFSAGRHIGLVGITGTGKTEFGRRIVLPEFGRRLVLDTEDRQFEDYTKVSRWQATYRAAGDGSWKYRILMNPGDEESVDKLCAGLLDKGHDMILFVDEVADFVQPGSIPEGLHLLIRKARKRRITVAWTTQRPQEVHRVLWTQTAHKFCWYLDDYDTIGANRSYLEWARREMPWIEQDPTPRAEDEPPHRFVYKSPSGQIRRFEAVKM